jgi:hypothetical protein
MEEKRLMARLKEHLQKRSEEKLKNLLRQEQDMERRLEILQRNGDYLTKPIIEEKLEDTQTRIKDLTKKATPIHSPA